MPTVMSMPQLMQWLKAMISEVPRYDSASRIAFKACPGLAPMAIWQT